MKTKPTPIDGLNLWSRADVMKTLGIGEKALQKLTSTRQLRSIRVGRYVRFTAKAIQEYIQRQEERAS